MMKRLLCLIPALGAACAAGGETPGSRYREVEVPPVRAFTPAEAQRRVLASSGVPAFLIEDPELPVVTIKVWVRGGSYRDPAEKAGLHAMMGTVLRTGGTHGKTGDEIDRLLESRGADLDVTVEALRIEVSLTCLADDAALFVPLLAEILREPEFRPEKIDLARTEMLTAISRRNDDPEHTAVREFRKVIYGPQSPYARTTEDETVRAITRDDLCAAAQGVFQRNGLIVGGVGRFRSDDLAALLDHELAGLPPAAELRDDAFPQELQTAPVGIYQAAKDDVNQSTILIGHPGFRREHPDYALLLLANEAFGGGMGARLFSRVRSQQGLAYSVWSAPGAEWGYPGIWHMGCQTKSETTATAIESLQREMGLLLSDGLTETEIENARANLLNSMVFWFDTREKVLDRALRYAYFGMPAGFLEKLQREIRGATRDEVNAAIRRDIHAEECRIFVLGAPAAFERPLGKVTEVVLAKPKPVAPAVPPADEALKRGREWAEKIAAAMGGPEHIRGIKSLRVKGTYEMAMGDTPLSSPVEILFSFPDRIRMEIQTPSGAVVMSWNRTEGWITGPRGAVPMPVSQAAELKQRVALHPLWLLAQALGGAATVEDLGVSEKRRRLRVRVAEGSSVVWAVDEEAGLLRTMETEGERRTAVELDDYHEAGALKLPHRMKLTGEGAAPGTIVLREITINPEIRDEDFQKKP